MTADDHQNLERAQAEHDPSVGLGSARLRARERVTFRKRARAAQPWRSSEASNFWNRSSVLLKGSFKQHRALHLVVQLEVHPVHGVVAAPLLGRLDERAAHVRARGRRRSGRRRARSPRQLTMRCEVALRGYGGRRGRDRSSVSWYSRSIRAILGSLKLDAAALALAIDDLEFGDPVDAVGETHRVAAILLDHLAPQTARLAPDRPAVADLDELLGPLARDPLESRGQ